MKKTSAQKTISAIYMLEQGHSLSKVAAKLSLSKATVQRIRKAHLSRLVQRKPGYPKLLSVQQTRQIVRKITSGQLDTAVDATKFLQQHEQVTVDANTVRRALKQSGLKSAVKQKKPLLRPSHLQACLAFAKRHQDWTVDDWKHVIWSDETKINRFGSDGRKWCWKWPGARLGSNQVQKTLKHGGGSIMVWGCMTAERSGFLTKIEGGLDAELYCSILEDELKQTMEWYRLEHNKVIF